MRRTIHFNLFIQCALMLFVLVLLGLSKDALAATLYVDTAGNDANNCTTAVGGGDACLTIQRAIAVATSGDTVSVAAGTYANTTTIGLSGKNLILSGAGRDTTTITSTAANAIDVISGETGVTIQNFKIQAASGNYAIRIQGNSQVTVTNNDITNTTNRGIYVSSGVVTITNNRIFDCVGYGVLLYNGSPNKVVLYNNIIAGNADSGIYVTGGSNGLFSISRNLIVGNSANGIGFYSGNNNYSNASIITNNTILGNSTGFAHDTTQLTWLRNNILAFNYGADNSTISSGNQHRAYNLVFDNNPNNMLGDANTVNSNPNFLNDVSGTATSTTTTTLTDTSKSWGANQWKGYLLNAGNSRRWWYIASNTADTLTVVTTVGTYEVSDFAGVGAAYTITNGTLQGGSPAINAGDPATNFNDADASRNDIGATGGPSTPVPLAMMPATTFIDDGAYGQTFALSGTRVLYALGESATYSWAQTGGTGVTLSSATAQNPTFTIPSNVSTLTFALTITSSTGAISMASNEQQVYTHDVVNLGGGGSYNTIQECITAGVAGGTCTTGAGTYIENVTINKNFTLIGQGESNTFIDGAGDTAINGGNGLTTSNGITALVRDLTVKQFANPNVGSGIGINVGGTSANNITFQNITSRDNGLDGFAMGAGVVTLNNVSVINNGRFGIYQNSAGTEAKVLNGVKVIGNGGTGINTNGLNTIVKNSIIANNNSNVDGGRFVTFENNIVSGTRSVATFTSSTTNGLTSDIRNNVFFGLANASNNLQLAGTTGTYNFYNNIIYYNDGTKLVCGTGGTYNIDYNLWYQNIGASDADCNNPDLSAHAVIADPQFVILTTGTSSAITQTTLTDNTANWSVNAYANKWLVPDTATVTKQGLSFYIVSNTANTMTVEVSSSAKAMDDYAIVAGNTYWVLDLTVAPTPATSPVIDAGSTANGSSSDYNGISRPRGAASEIGAIEFVTSDPPNQPTIDYPTNNLYNLDAHSMPAFVSTYHASQGDPLVSVDWQIVTNTGDPNGTQAYALLDETTSTLSMTVPADTLSAYTQYFVRTRHTNVHGDSAWSNWITFKTAFTGAVSSQTWHFNDASSNYTYNATKLSINAAGDSLVKVTDPTSMVFSVGGNSFTTRKPIVVTSPDTINSLQVRVVVAYASGMKTDFGDLRFTDSDGSTVLSYWVEEQQNTVNATVWVNVPNLSATVGKTIYMYYGNAGLSSASNANNTFLFGDDFAGPALNGGWTEITTGGATTGTFAGGQWTKSCNGECDWWSSSDLDAGARVPFPLVSDSDTTWEAVTRMTGTSGTGNKQFGMMLYQGLRDGWLFQRFSNGTAYAVTSIGAGDSCSISDSNPPVYLKIKKVTANGVGSNNDFQFWLSSNGSSWTRCGSYTANDIMSSVGLAVKDWDGSASGATYDYFYIKRYTSADPTVLVNAAERPFVYNDVSISPSSAGLHPWFSDIFSMSTTGVTGTMLYQMGLDSNRDGTVDHWYFVNLSNSCTWSDVADMTLDNNTLADVNSCLPGLKEQHGTGDLYPRVILVSGGAATSLDSLQIQMTLANQNPDSPTSLGPSSLTDGSISNDTTPTPSFSLTDPDAANTVKYHIMIDNDADFSSPVVEYTSALAAQGSASFTVGQAAGGGSYTTGSAGQTLADGSYYWRVRAIDNNNTNSSFVTARGGAVAFQIDTVVRNIQFTVTSTAQSEAITNPSLAISLSSTNFQNTSVNYAATAGTATGGGVDYTLASGTATITAGQTTANIPFTIVNDLLDEDNETIVVTLSSPVNGALGVNTTFTYTINDNDNPPTIAIQDLAVDENTGTAVVSVSLTGQSASTVTVDYATSNGTAIAGTDYTSKSGQLTWSSGQTGDKTFSVTIADDALDEDNEVVNLTLSNPSNGTISDSSGTLTITDNDAVPNVSFASTTQSGAEDVGTMTITAELDAVSGRTVTLPFSIHASSTAEDPSDYTITGSPVTITAGNTTTTMTVTVVDDDYDEDDETIVVDLGVPVHATRGVNARHTVTITDNDTAGITLTESSSATSVTEGGVTDTYTVALSSKPTSPVSLVVGSDAQTSVSPHALLLTALNWNIAQTITVSAVDDDVDEDNHSSTITQTSTSADSHYNALTSSLIATVIDNDTAGVSLTEVSGAVEEGQSGTYTIVLTSEPTSNVNVTLAADSQSSVDRNSVVFTMANWDLPKTITATIADDHIAEGNHSTTIQHSASSVDTKYNHIIINNRIILITDNDSSGVTMTNTNSGTAISTSGTTNTVRVVLTSQPTADVTIKISSGEDLTFDTTSLTFTASTWHEEQEVEVSLAEDAVLTGTSATVSAAATSADTEYDKIGIESLTVSLLDDGGSDIEAVAENANCADASVFEGANYTLGTTCTGLNGSASGVEFVWTQVSGQSVNLGEGLHPIISIPTGNTVPFVFLLSVYEDGVTIFTDQITIRPIKKNITLASSDGGSSTSGGAAATTHESKKQVFVSRDGRFVKMNSEEASGYYLLDLDYGVKVYSKEILNRRSIVFLDHGIVIGGPHVNSGRGLVVLISSSIVNREYYLNDPQLAFKPGVLAVAEGAQVGKRFGYPVQRGYSDGDGILVFALGAGPSHTNGGAYILDSHTLELLNYIKGSEDNILTNKNVFSKFSSEDTGSRLVMGVTSSSNIHASESAYLTVEESLPEADTVQILDDALDSDFDFDVDEALSTIPLDSISQMAGGDVDGDGETDLVVAYSDTCEINLFFGGTLNEETGENFFTTENIMACTETNPITSLEIGDVNGDGVSDIVIGVNGSNRIIVVLGGTHLKTSDSVEDNAIVVDGLSGTGSWITLANDGTIYTSDGDGGSISFVLQGSALVDGSGDSTDDEPSGADLLGPGGVGCSLVVEVSHQETGRFIILLLAVFLVAVHRQRTRSRSI